MTRTAFMLLLTLGGCTDPQYCREAIIGLGAGYLGRGTETRCPYTGQTIEPIPFDGESMMGICRCPAPLAEVPTQTGAGR